MPEWLGRPRDRRVDVTPCRGEGLRWADWCHAAPRRLADRMTREARAAPEFAAFTLTAGPLLATLPRGDGHPVLVLPGLGGSDSSTAPLRWFLGQLGYRSFGWGLGENRGFGRHVTDGLDELLAAKRERGTGRASSAGASAACTPSTWLAAAPTPSDR